MLQEVVERAVWEAAEADSATATTAEADPATATLPADVTTTAIRTAKLDHTSATTAAATPTAAASIANAAIAQQQLQPPAMLDKRRTSAKGKNSWEGIPGAGKEPIPAIKEDETQRTATPFSADCWCLPHRLKMII
jgi:hypothetical protein